MNYRLCLLLQGGKGRLEGLEWFRTGPVVSVLERKDWYAWGFGMSQMRTTSPETIIVVL